MNSNIEYVCDAEVDAPLDGELRELLTECFPRDPVFLTQRFNLEPPHHRFVIRGEHGVLSAHIAVHDKAVMASSGPVRIAGIAEVCDRADARGRGIVRYLLDHISASPQCAAMEAAILFGKAEVYRSSGFREMTNPLPYRRIDGSWTVEPSPSAMVRALWGRPFPEGPVDLCWPMF